MTTDFVHLRVHTEYSIVDGIVRIKPLVQAVAAANMHTVAITDQNNIFAAIKFYKAAISAGIKPIIGVDILLNNEQQIKNPFRLTLLCQNETGYKNITQLISRADVEAQVVDKPMVDKNWLQNATEGLIALSGAREGDVGQFLLNGNKNAAQQSLNFWLNLFPDRYYLEVQRTGRAQEDQYCHMIVELAQQFDVPIVATNDVRFINTDDFEAHEARVCIHEGYTLNDTNRSHHYSEQQYLRTPAEMAVLFADLPEALENTVEIAKRCNLEIVLGKNYLPNFPTPDNIPIDQYLMQQAKQGLENRLAKLFDINSAEFTAKRQPYDERLNMEVEVINRMGFAGYFLIVADFISWAKQNNIPVGPGRGSGAGSLVAYSLQITDLDPLAYELLFERFLNPERKSMPDIDIDFCMDGRDRVIEYVAHKYGRDSVSQIITYGSMAAKAAVRDVGRVLGHPYGFVDKIAKLIPFELGITLDKALEQEEDVKTLIDLARKLEGITRNAGKHAGGVVISPSLITDFAPLYCEPGGEHPVTQFDKDDVEAVGLVKFDFLGLRTLTIIDWALQTINAKRKQENLEPLDISLLPTNDSETFKLIKSCATTAVFQLESRGMKDLIKRLQPDNFEEIIALVALFRPGPLQSGMVDDFINRKFGRAKVEYLYPTLENILKPTYGIIVYQEQVMQISQVLAGYSKGQADGLRKAMGKKKPEEMAEQRTIFTTGATTLGVNATIATTIFDLMEKFAGYGFNKSHSAAYALVSYQTAWLKAHYPAQFMAAVLSSDMDNTDKVVMFLEECRNMKLTIIPPHINHSQYKFTVNDKNEIIYGLGAIKGVGEAAISLIINSRNQEGQFKDLFDFCYRMDLRKVNRRVLEALICSGSFDNTVTHRASMMATLDKAILAAEQFEASQLAGQGDLFGHTDTLIKTATTEYIKIAEYTDDQRLTNEKEVLGHYLSGHPINSHQTELKQFISTKLCDVQSASNQTIIVAGLIMGMRTMFTKRGDRIAFVVLDDCSARIELTVFSELFDNYKSILLKDSIIVTEAEVSIDNFTGNFKLVAKSIYTLEQAREKFARHIQLELEKQELNDQLLNKLTSILQPYRPGKCSVQIQYQAHSAAALLQLGEQWRVRLTNDLLQGLRNLLGVDQVKVVY